MKDESNPLDEDLSFPPLLEVSMKTFCECGCRQMLPVKLYRSQNNRHFLHGHWAKSQQGRKRISQTQFIALPVDEVITLYTKGYSVYTIGTRFKVNQDKIWRLLRDNGIKLRRPGQLGHKWGKEHTNWKGNDANYAALHTRVWRRRGQKNECEVCGTSDPKKWYEWANLTGHYEDPDDFKRMCRSCHRKYDNARRRICT